MRLPQRREAFEEVIVFPMFSSRPRPDLNIDRPSYGPAESALVVHLRAISCRKSIDSNPVSDALLTFSYHYPNGLFRVVVLVLDNTIRVCAS